MFYDPSPQLFCLSNGSLFISESLSTKALSIAGPSGVAYLVAHELCHLSRRDLSTNLASTTKRGDLKKLLFMF
jgi:predicted metal-dependent hydrolase